MTLLPTTTAARHGQVAVAYGMSSVSLHSSPFRLQNFQSTFGSGSKRGSDRVIPHLSGVRARRRRITATEVVWNLFVAGDVNAAGTPYSSYPIGLESNCNILEALCDDPGSNGTRDVTVTWPSTATSTKAVHIIEFVPGDIVAPGIMTATLAVSIPGGRF